MDREEKQQLIMDRQQLKIANQQLLTLREADKHNNITIPSSVQDKLQKCENGSKLPLATDEAVIANPDWPPDSLKPESIGSNLEQWEAFNWDHHPKLREAKPIIVDWYNELPDSGALVLAGNVGCGKTHIAQALADLYGRWRISSYEEVELVKKIQSTYGDKSQSEESIMRLLLRSSLLILDDLGTYQTNNPQWIGNIYNRIFNDYLTVQNKPILITTNMPMFGTNSIEARIGARSFSRLCDALGEKKRYVDLFDVQDYRIERFLA